MNILSSFLVALGLSMDNLAVTISAGCSQRAKGQGKMFWQVSLLFALAHFVMFAVGFEGGVLLHASQTIAPWLGSAILLFIGGRMIKNARAQETFNCGTILNSLRTQLLLALATSVDALFVGAGLAFTHALFWQTQTALVLCVFMTSLCGFHLGSYLGRKFGNMMEVLGGIVLVILGIKVLLEGVGIW